MEKFNQAKNTVKPGKYIIAVSGGVDSVTLLDLLVQSKDLELIVAHVDHGIRKISQQDRKFVHKLAMSHNLTFVYHSAELGVKASEQTAREARYIFLRRMCKKYNASGIITAHHQDDQRETAIINLLRGTGRRGLSALRHHETLLRPLLAITKEEIIAYAKQRQLEWREDATNLYTHYLRNSVRNNLLNKSLQSDKEKLTQIIVRQNSLNEQIDKQLRVWLNAHGLLSPTTVSLPRYQLIMLPPDVALEIMQTAVYHVSGRTVERPLAERALLFAKTARLHRCFELNKMWRLRTSHHIVIVEPREPVIS